MCKNMHRVIIKKKKKEQKREKTWEVRNLVSFIQKEKLVVDSRNSSVARLVQKLYSANDNKLFLSFCTFKN